MFEDLTEENLEKALKAIQKFQEEAKLDMDKQNHPHQIHVRKSSIYLEDFPEIVTCLELLISRKKNV